MAQPPPKSFPLPTDWPTAPRSVRDELLRDLGVAPDNFKAMAQAVMSLSDFYVKHPEKSTPWDETWTQIAYAAYYLPLNWWRLMGVIARGQQLNFFDGFEHYIDFGSGLGSLGLAFDAADLAFKSGVCVERGREAVYMHRRLATETLTPLEWVSTKPAAPLRPHTLAVFSYSLTELTKLPDWALAADGMMIVEPSTRDDARRLQTLRNTMLEDGWHVWGPCTHSAPCPLLTAGERDWCHDRITWQQPDWLGQIEAHMPIKNGTLPCSWLLLRRDRPVTLPANAARFTGDLQEFKGFAKQLICRGEHREFAAWQKKDFKKSYPQFGRGDLVTLRPDLPHKGNEIRASASEDIAGVGRVE
jgi:hypothetical protein